MKHQVWSRHLTAGVAIAALLGTMLTAATAYSQGGAYVENKVQATATVTGIDPETRLISIRTANGDEVSVEAGPEVRNFDQIEEGDRIDVVYYQAIAAELTQAPASAAGSEPVIVETGRAPLGEKPAGKAGLMYTAIVTIDAVDTETHTVKFTGPGGQPREVTAMRPEVQEFVDGLQPGDRVQVTYGESLAVAVNPREE
jgi:hypothetical protein